MASLYVGIVFLVLSYPGYLMLKTFFKRTRPFWIRTLFPLGYAIYKTRIGYGLHLRKLKQGKVHPHSITSPVTLSVVSIVPVAVLEDNYSYLIIDSVTNMAVAVDPCDPTAVMKAVLDNQATLTAILTTHKHWDHAGGNDILKKHYPDVKVYGGVDENVPGGTDKVRDGDTIKLGRLSFEAVWTPGHTTGHMMYKLKNEPPCVFTGDHIFVCGNGQMFEGSAETMLSSIEKVKCLPRNSLLFPGHEYALKDVRFAAQLLPSNKAVQIKWQWVKQQRERNLCTVPSILSEEMTYNPFMLTGDPQLKEALGLPENTPPAEVLAELRREKNKSQTAF